MFFAANRRQFLRFGIATLLSTGMLLGGETIAFAQQSGQSKQKDENFLPAAKPDAPLTRSKFSAHLSELFVFRMNGEEVHMQLVKIEDLKESNIGKAQLRKLEDATFKAKWQEESFSLTFRTMSEQPIRQGTYKLKHDGLGQVEIFLTPVGRPEGPWRMFEAIFNRLPQ